MKLFKSKKAFNSNIHIIIGLAVLIILYYLNLTYKWIEAPAKQMDLIKLVFIGALYSVIPYVDQPGSKINKVVTIALVALVIYAFYNQQYLQYGIIAAVILGLLRIIEHRTIIHSVLGAVVIASPLLYLGFIYFLVGVISFLSHIISDNDFSFGWEKDHRLGGRR